MEIIPLKLSELSPKQIRCLPLLASGMSAVDVSKKLKVSQQRISEWRRDARFQTALDMARNEALVNAQCALSSLAEDSVASLKELLKNAKNEQTKLRAAIFIIERLGITSGTDKLNDKIDFDKKNINMNLLLTALTGN